MITNKIDENTFEVLIYDWINLHDDYVCGHIKREPKADEGSDLRYWMFYPSGDKFPINSGDLKRISYFIVGLNTHDA